MAILDELGAADYARRLPAALPYAIQKRTALARALMAEPRLLLLDEPASGLSESEMDALGRCVRGLTERMSVLLVEHHMDLVMSVCDRLVVLNFGQVIAEGTPAVIRSDPDVATAYLGDPVDGAPPDRGPTMLEVRDLSVSFGAVQALRSVSFEAEAGAVTAVLGANGAGKTTLLRTISGLVKPLDGSVRFDGDPLVGRAMSSRSRGWASPTYPRVGGSSRS